jgi:glycogen(starch) synthase
MNHLIISREYPPAPYLGGGIGTYVDHISRLLAERGETVHVIAQLCPAATRPRETRAGGRLIVHRVPVDRPLAVANEEARSHRAILDALRDSVVPCQAFLWQAAILAESLIEGAGIDVIEAQEYEAPLYFLMLRRALGLGPRRQVPLIVHLHSPTEFVFTENQCQARPDYVPLTRLEAYTIHAADALMCPSRFLARSAESHYGLKRGAVEVIPYPLGTASVSPRTARTWRDGSISYIGRLEPRKGVREWVEAAAAVAAEDPSPHFSFVGADTTQPGLDDRSMRSFLRASIPPSMQSRFSFSEVVPKHRLVAHRARARIAVVPSRWENFPYSCIEAMASGLPVLVSPDGGMAEMIEDGRTGWVAAGSDSVSLATALGRALSASPESLAAMGAAAAESIRAVCGNDVIVGRHLALKREVINRGCRQVVEMPTPPVPLPDPGYVRRRQTAMRGMQTDTMTPMEILRAPRAQQLAVIRRALINPAYLARWLVWHASRLAGGWISR